jgi:hypothetical protein
VADPIIRFGMLIVRTRQAMDEERRTAQLLLFSRTGFTDGLREAARTRADVELVDLARLYTGD